MSDKCISEFITTSVFKSPDINDGISGLFLAAIKDKKAFDLKIAEKAKAEAEEKAKAEAEQARSRAEKADAKKTATLTNNPELTNSNTAANEPSTATDSIIAIAIFLAVIFLAYIVIRKTLRGIKRSK